jgi:hypothetical protein
MKKKDIKFVDRSKIRTSQVRSSKFKALLNALDQLEPNGKAVKVSYSNDKEVNSMRTAVYKYNNDHGIKVRSRKDSQNKQIYFYRES